MGQVKEHWVVSGNANIQASVEELIKWRIFQLQEEKVITGRRHSDADLVQIEEVFERGILV